jgi:hypothetical protein
MHRLLNSWRIRFFCSCMHRPPPTHHHPHDVYYLLLSWRGLPTVLLAPSMRHLHDHPALPPPHHRLSVPQVRRRLCHRAEESVGVLRQRKPSLPHSRRHVTVSVSERASKQRAKQRIHDASSRAGTAWMLLARDGNVSSSKRQVLGSTGIHS